MQLLICPGYHSPKLTEALVRCVRRRLSPDRLWVLPIGQSGGALPWLMRGDQGPQRCRALQILAFSAGVVAAYPLALAWQQFGGSVRFLAMDGWGMPLLGSFPVYRLSHDGWTHKTTVFPSPRESRGYFYADPAVDHLFLWHSPHATVGVGSLHGQVKPMTALDFIAAVVDV